MEGEENIITPENSNSDEFERLTCTSSSLDPEMHRQLKIAQLEEQLTKNADVFSRENNLLFEQVKDLTEKLERMNQEKTSKVVDHEFADHDISINNLTEQLKTANEELDKHEIEKIEITKKLDLSQKEIEILKNDAKMTNDKMQKMKNAIVRKTKEAIEARQQNSDIQLTAAYLNETVEKLKTELEECKMELAATISEQAKSMDNANSEKTEVVRTCQHFQRLYEATLADLKCQQAHTATVQTDFDDYKTRSRTILESQLNAIADEKRAAGENEKIKILESQVDVLRNSLECSNLDLQTARNSFATVCRRFILVRQQIAGIIPFFSLSLVFDRLYDLNTKLGVIMSKYKRHYDTGVSESRLSKSKYLLEINNLLVKLASYEEETARLLAERRESSFPGSKDARKSTSSLETELDYENSKKSSSVTGARVLQEIVSEFPAQENIKLSMAKSKAELYNLNELLGESKRNEVLMANQLSLMKEEVRRMGRAIEGNSNIANMEYLKNIVFKFLTLPHGDQRVTLVAVIQSLLSFSEEEMSVLEAVASGRSIEEIDGWGSYLYSFIDHGIKYIRPS